MTTQTKVAIIGLITITTGGLLFNDCSRMQSANSSIASQATNGVAPASTAVIVASVSGAFNQGSTVTISGSGFGTRPSSTPVYFSNYDSFPLKDSVLNTGLAAPMGIIPNEPYVDNTHAVSGAQALRMDYPLNDNGEFPEVMLTGLNMTELYVSAWIYWERTAGTGAGAGSDGFPIVKLVRAEANPPYHGYPGFYETIRPDASGQIVASDRGSIDSNGSVTNDDTINAGQTSGEWHRIEYYFKLSTPGVADGVFQTWVDGVMNADIKNTMSRPAGNSATINNVISPYDGISNYGLTNSYSLWVDNFYVDSTRARVELGDAPTYAGCKVKYIQPSTAWADGAVNITVNINKFSLGQNVYLYVIGPDGGVNTAGYPVTIGN